MAPGPDAQSLKDAARQALGAGQNAAAVGLLESAVQITPQDKGAWLELASLYEQAGRMPDAWTAYQAVVRLAPNDLDVLAPLLGFLVRGRRVEGIMPLYHQLVLLGWGDARGMAALGNALISFFQYAEAEQVFRRTHALAPENEVVLRGLGITLNALKRFDEAVACLEKVADPPPGQPVSKGNVIARVHLLSARAGAALSAGNAAGAAELFSQAIDLQRLTGVDIGRVQGAR